MNILGLKQNHEKLYYYILILTAICLPVSKFALSVSMILLIINFLFELDFRKKLEILKRNKSIVIFCGVFAIHVLWLINSKDFKYAFHDIGNKAILILYPIIIGTSKYLSLKKIKTIVLWFSASLLVSTLISTYVLLGFSSIDISDIRNISLFMSHIRMSLLINMSLFALSYFFLSAEVKLRKIEIYVFPIVVIWFIVFLFLLKSLTGIIIFLILLFGSFLYLSFKLENRIYRLLFKFLFIAIFLFVSLFLTISINKYYNIENINFSELEKYTQSGNKYQHFTSEYQTDNGHYTWVYISEKELKNEWQRRSRYKYDGKDDKGQNLKITLIRYLTSRGLRKDSIGVASLTNKDIKNIESGLANYIYEDKYAVYPLLYKVIWQIDMYMKGRSPAGNSVTQRFEFLKAAKGIVENNLLLGVGTGNVKIAFAVQYETMKSELPKDKRLRAHNQYVTFLLTFGIFGFILLFFCMLYPVVRLKGYDSYLFLVLILITLLSFINEDTLETQIGVTFFSYFYSLFLFRETKSLK
ncbi:MAG: O-antigen ligase family protein [Bacteroidales bacterium]|nr:O-antigen ligase family protein [Bacteroidales bacterium]